MGFYAPEVLIATNPGGLKGSGLSKACVRLLGERFLSISEDGVCLMVADSGAPSGRSESVKFSAALDELMDIAGSSGCDALRVALGGDRGVFGLELAIPTAYPPLAAPVGLLEAGDGPKELMVTAAGPGDGFERESHALRRLESELGAPLTLMVSQPMINGQVSLCARFDFQELSPLAARAAAAAALLGVQEAMSEQGSLGEISREWAASARYGSGWASVGNSGEWCAEAPWVGEIYAAMKATRPARRILGRARPAPSAPAGARLKP